MKSIDVDVLRQSAQDPSLIKLLDVIIMEAIAEKASGIHIEPFEDKLSIRYRIDGVLYEIPPPAGQVCLPLVSRIKMLAKMDIAERELPQDGSFTIRMKDRTISLRVATAPTICGEKVVIRLVDTARMAIGLDDLGIEPDMLARIRTCMARPSGLILITGPMGSGKTTTLYAALRELCTPRRNIVTIEDPVEYGIVGVNQVQVKPAAGLTFASGITAFLQQDPDIIMAGEVRDAETAQACIRAAVTGKFVLSALYTKSTETAPQSLIDFGIDPFLVNSSLMMVIAQRLVRRLCPACRQGEEPDRDTQKRYRLKKGQVYRAVGCDKCRHIGYSGRVGIFEVLTITDAIKKLILERRPPATIRDVALKQGMKTLLQSGMQKVAQGITSLQEVRNTL